MQIVVYYFKDLFASLTGIDDSEWSNFLEIIPLVVTDDQNGQLLVEFSEDETETALNQMDPWKARDGFNSMFYQHFWTMVKEDVISTDLNF